MTPNRCIAVHNMTGHIMGGGVIKKKLFLHCGPHCITHSTVHQAIQQDICLHSLSYLCQHIHCALTSCLYTLLFCMSSVLGHQDFCTDRTGKFFAGPASGGRTAQLVRTELRNSQPGFTWKVLMRFLVRLQIQDREAASPPVSCTLHQLAVIAQS